MTNNHPAIVRILLDNQSNQLETIASAAALARQLQSSLQGVFLADDVLFQVAGLPFAQEISRWSAQESPITLNGLERTLRARAKHLQKELEYAAKQAQIPYSFQYIRGERMHWILESQSSADFLFVSNIKPSPKLPQTLMLQSQPIQLIYSATEASERALKMALQLANQTFRPLSILIISKEPQQHIQHIHATLDQSPVNTAVSIKDISLADIQSIVQQTFPYRLILPTDIALVKETKILELLLEKTRCPIIFVR